MSVKGIRTFVLAAGFALTADLAAQETYHQRAVSAGERRARLSMEQFRSNLSSSRLSGDQSSSRILLSFSRFVPANEVIADMLALEIEIDEMQVCVGEDCYSIPVDRNDPVRTEPIARAQAMQYIAHGKSRVERLLASETLDTTRHWLFESLRFTEAYQSRMAESDQLLVSGIGCVASNEEIESYLVEQPSLVRAVE